MHCLLSLKRILILLFFICIYHFGLSQEFDSKRIRLGDHINTRYTETKPIIAYDNATLVLTRQNHPDNAGGIKDIQDIYISIRDDEGYWTSPINIGGPLNNEHPNGISSLSKSGDTSLVINKWEEWGYEKGASLSFKTNDQWSNPQPINIENFKNKSDFVDYFKSADGDHLFLAIEGKDSYGDQDLYISYKIDDYNYSKPINLGSTINTPEGEFSPFLASDNNTLFFASYGHGGFGESDIYYSRRLDDSWTNWSEPKNLGPNINTSGFEAYFTIPTKGDYAYFVSDVDSNKGSRDIFKAFIPLELNPTPGIVISGKTKNELTKELVAANVKLSPVKKGIEIKEFETNASNEFTFKRSIFQFPMTYKMIAHQKGFMSAFQYLSIAYKDRRETNIDLFMVPIEVGNTLVSHDVSFESNSNKLNSRGKTEVDRIIGYMTEYASIKMDIGAFVKATSSASNDLNLSIERLDVVYQLFIDAGIDENRLSKAAFGSQQSFKNSNNLLIMNGDDLDNRFTFTIYPDMDGDGVEDKKDKCVDEPGLRKNAGCPEITEETKEVFAQALSGIQFETSKDIIKPVSYQILDNVVRIMNENPIYFLKIKGHTDSQGTTDFNQELSDARAMSTLKYLADHGVQEDRMKAFGYGESEPVADNNTKAGRRQNRRVVFEIVFEEAELIQK